MEKVAGVIAHFPGLDVDGSVMRPVAGIRAGRTERTRRAACKHRVTGKAPRILRPTQDRTGSASRSGKPKDRNLQDQILALDRGNELPPG